MAKKGAASKNDRRSSSRHSTPLSALGSPAPPTPQQATPTSAAQAPTMPKETAYIHTMTSALVSPDPSIEALIEKSNSALTKGDPPSSKELQLLHDKIKDSVANFMGKRSSVCDRSMRQLAQKRNQQFRAQQEREMEQARLKREEEEAGERKKVRKLGKKRSRDAMEVDAEASESREEKMEVLPSVGAHGIARQDGVGVHQGQVAPPSPKVAPGTVDAMDTAGSPSESEASRAEPPAIAPLYERAFGKDPTKMDDPTVYSIRDVLDDMPEEEQREILNVAHWPDSDLRDLTAGDPPDQDFSNAKPSNQVNFSTFQTYVEPFIRPFTEEDVAFLKERGDRFTPYLIPQRGPRGYKEVWAAEDGMDGIAPPRKQEMNPNEARGSMEEMNDDTAETDEVSMGPVMNRLLSIIRPQPNGSAKKEPIEDVEGDVSMVNGDDSQPPDQATAGAEDLSTQHKPVTLLPPDAPRATNLTPADYETIEQRAIQELRHIGFLSPDDIPDYASQNDDEVAARLRTLQHELRRVSRVNNIRKSRVLELTEERMAMQEYSNIADDLDNQVNAAYLKRNRSLAKPASKKGSASAAALRAGQKGVAGAVGGGRGVSDGVRALMQKRRDWIDMVGPVVGYGRPPIPGDGETVFDEGSLRRLERGEREAEAGEAEEG